MLKRWGAFEAGLVLAQGWVLSILSLRLRLGSRDDIHHHLPSGEKRPKSVQPQQVQRCGARLHGPATIR
jgi:hypothetical protein